MKTLIGALILVSSLTLNAQQFTNVVYKQVKDVGQTLINYVHSEAGKVENPLFVWISYSSPNLTGFNIQLKHIGVDYDMAHNYPHFNDGEYLIFGPTQVFDKLNKKGNWQLNIDPVNMFVHSWGIGYIPPVPIIPEPSNVILFLIGGLCLLFRQNKN